MVKKKINVKKHKRKGYYREDGTWVDPTQVKAHTRKVKINNNKKENIIKKAKENLNGSLFKSANYKKYDNIVDFENTKKAKESSEKLMKEFNDAEQDAKRLRIARVTQYSANRANATLKRENLSDKEIKQYKEIGKIYNKKAKKCGKSTINLNKILRDN